MQALGAGRGTGREEEAGKGQKSLQRRTLPWSKTSRVWSSSSKQAVKRGEIRERWNPSRGITICRSAKVRNPRKCQEYKLLELAGAQDGLWGMAGNGAKKDGTESDYDERPCLIKIWINLYVMEILNFSQLRDPRPCQGASFPKNTMWMVYKAAVLCSFVRPFTSKKAELTHQHIPSI